MIKHETKASELFRHWLKANPYFTSSFEMKDTRGKNSLPFSDVPQEQIDWGMAIKSPKGVLIRTQSVSNGMPDYIYLRGEPAWIVVKYPTAIEIIDVETFAMERDRSKAKSLTHERARAISVKSIKLRQKP